MFFIALIVCASLFACVKPAMNVGETIDDAINGETITETKPEETSATEPIEDNTIAFEYKMAEVKPRSQTKNQTQYYYAIEFMHNEHSAATFVPLFEDGTKLEEKYPNVQIETYNGHICNGDFATHTEGDISLSNFRELITIVITVDEKIESNEKISFNTSIMHRENGKTEEIKLTVNEEIENITTTQNIICGKTLVNLNNDYYVFYRIGTGENEKPIGVFTSYSLLPIGDETTTLSDKFSKNISFVNAKNEKIVLAEGYAVYFVPNATGFDIGVKSTIEPKTIENEDGTKTEETVVTDENIMNTNVFLKFKDEKGNELNFVSNVKKSS